MDISTSLLDLAKKYSDPASNSVKSSPYILTGKDRPTGIAKIDYDPCGGKLYNPRIDLSWHDNKVRADFYLNTVATPIKKLKRSPETSKWLDNELTKLIQEMFESIA